MKFLLLIAILGIVGGILATDTDLQELKEENQFHPKNIIPAQTRHSRVKRNWPFRSSQRNADIINSYYQAKPEDTWWVQNVEKPFARYVGRAFGDEFPRVRDSIMEHQNNGMGFWESHNFEAGTHPKNWIAYNWGNDDEESTNPYNGVNQFGESPFLSQFNFYNDLLRNGE